MARIVYMGTPEYARWILERIWSNAHDFLVVTKPDRPMGRHRRMTPTPVAEWATARGMVVLRPEKLGDVRESFTSFDPDYIVSAAFGRILRPWLLDMPRWGSYNLHASLLPRWRGANPIAWAIRAGDVVTGITLMRMDSGIDTGPIVAQSIVPIEDDDTTGTLTQKLADRAASLWIETLSALGPGVFRSSPQPVGGVTMAPKFDSGAGHIDWQLSAREIHNQVRSMSPEPGLFIDCNGVRIKLWQTAADSLGHLVRPGVAILDGNDWVVGCGQGLLRILTIQPVSRRSMTPGDYVRGLRSVSREWVLQ